MRNTTILEHAPKTSGGHNYDHLTQNTQLTPRPATMASWESIPETEKQFQRRLMEVWAGLLEHADIYSDGWFAGAFGLRTPWVPGFPPSVKDWNPEKDVWELYNLHEDWSQANDLAAKMPDKLAQMKSLFLVESAKNLNLPIGGGCWSTPAFHPEDAPVPPYTEWTFTGSITGMPELAAPRLGKADHSASMEVTVPEKANGVLHAIGGFGGGLTLFVKDGVLSYEYNAFMLKRTKLVASEKLPLGKVKIEVEERLTAPKPGSPLEVTLKVNGKIVAHGQIPAAAFQFSFNDGFDIGSDLGSPVSADYYDQVPFKFNGTIGTTKIAYPKK